MNRLELDLAAELLEKIAVSDALSDKGYDRFELPEHWTQAECDALMMAMAAWSGDPGGYSPGHRVTMDWHVMSYLAAMLRKACVIDGRLISPDFIQVLTTCDGNGSLMPSYLRTDISGRMKAAGLVEDFTDEGTGLFWQRLTDAGRVAAALCPR